MDAKRKTGRPEDKSSYIQNIISGFSHRIGNNEKLSKALNKLKADELLLLNSYIAKTRSLPIELTLKHLPIDTPAQTARYNRAIEYYKQLEIKNANDTKETIAETDSQTVSS
jgi:hypothetical protein